MNFNHKPEQSEYGLVPKGDYETFIERAEERPTNNGRKRLCLMLRIRKDIEQPCQNQCLFYELNQKSPEKVKEEDIQVNEYSYNAVYNLLDFSGAIASGKNFDTVNDFCRALIGCNLRVTVYHDEYNGKTRAKINPFKGIHPPKDDSAPAQNNLTPAYGAPTKTPAYSSAPHAPVVPPAPAAPASGSIDDFDEIISGGDDLPF